MVTKKREHEKKKAERKAKDIESGAPVASVPSPDVKEKDESDGDEDMAMSEDEEEKVKQEAATPITPLDQLVIAEGLKRKRDDGEEPETIKEEEQHATPSKRIRSETPPPPPPPPPANDISIVSNDALDPEMNQRNPSASHQSPPETEEAMQEPYIETVPRSSSSDIMEVTRDGVDSSDHVHSPDTPTTTSPDDEKIGGHNQHFSNHTHGPLSEVQVHGGA